MSKQSQRRPQRPQPTGAPRDTLPFMQALMAGVHDMQTHTPLPAGYYLHITHEAGCGRVQGHDCTCRPVLHFRHRPDLRQALPQGAPLAVVETISTEDI